MFSGMRKGPGNRLEAGIKLSATTTYQLRVRTCCLPSSKSADDQVLHKVIKRQPMASALFCNRAR
jgi:hypothetical protein